MTTFSDKKVAGNYAGEKNLEGENKTPRDMGMTMMMNYPAKSYSLVHGFRTLCCTKKDINRNLSQLNFISS